MKQKKKVLIFLFVIMLTAPFVLSQNGEFMRVENNPKHHADSGFQNDPFIESASSKGVLFYLRRFWGSIFTPDVPDGHVLSKSEAAQMLNSVKGDSITWLGHASFLIRVSGKTILTDPFLTEFASPVSWAGPRRFVNHAISLDELPPIDILLISHNHYDHLDDKTVRSLVNKDKIRVVIPLGLKAFFTERGYKNIIELDWSESVSIDNIKFTALPAVHDSARSTTDGDQTLWASWAIKSLKNKIFFVGDSGYSDTIFKDINKKHGSFDYAILPIGAYEPRELMWMSHINPKEAVAIGKEVDAKRLIASHWGTISSLSDEPPWEPPKKFREAGFDGGFSEDALWIMKIGETRPFISD
jgi:L-ascorbate metabolism protein UlaG (beta-lactamase superfamily)